MSEENKWIVPCPDCGCTLAIDRETGAVLYHEPAPAKVSPEKDFDSLLAGLDASKARADEIFRQEVSALEDKDRLMEEKFREAMKRIDEVDDGKPPVRPWDLD